MQHENITKMEMARRMKTSRAALDHLLNPVNASVTLQTLTRAVQAPRDSHLVARRAFQQIAKPL